MFEYGSEKPTKEKHKRTFRLNPVPAVINIPAVQYSLSRHQSLFPTTTGKTFVPLVLEKE